MKHKDVRVSIVVVGGIFLAVAFVLSRAGNAILAVLPLPRLYIHSNRRGKGGFTAVQ